ncbi:PKD domain-containing protein [Ichthyenterobacterium magnum]|uniref:Gliding motility-associated-like protein n=1 Tax=Ichthyenterobacterium magnum TaxID=1230530 RepID=A0A420DVU8_9FLAO|nr:PKD domain-containing protein [Ichthyenterobacterium magnum]RKE98354.1 gliding motility-associated-like protein [Ichthyenterobacterium magnum]
MNKNYSKALLFICRFSIILIGLYASKTLAKDLSFNEKMSVSNNYFFAPGATISGTTQVCKDDTPFPQITFTGSGGTTPYTFTYTINGGAPQTITTNSNTVTLPVSTNTIGTFTYQLISVEDNTGEVTNENGTAVVTVSQPDISFSFNGANVCSGDLVTYTSSVTGIGPFTYSWNFGDGTPTSALENPTHAFTSLGCGTNTFTTTLTVTDSNGCSNTVSNPITILESPEISFIDLDAQFTEPFNNCGNNTSNPEYTINVGDTSVSTSCITNYDIDWGDGNTETNVTFPLAHTYTQLGSYNMIITASGTNGCNTSVNYLIKNSSNPIGAIEIPGNTVNLCIPVSPIDFAIGSWGTNPPDTVYNIDYGDGTILVLTQNTLEASIYFNASDPAASQNYPIPYTYTESNCPNPNYTVNLTITTSCGETILTAGPIIILQQPEVDFDVDPIACVNTAVQFTNTTTGGFNQNCTTNSLYFWDFGDGNTSTDENPTHFYTTPGNYTVTLYAENFCGTTDPVTKPICIEPELIPLFNLSTNNGCSPLQVTITNTTDVSQSCGGDEYLWEVTYTPSFCGTVEDWSFANGTDENSVNPSFNFIAAGTYTLQLTATNSCGSNTTTEVIEVKQPPTALLNPIADFCGTASINPVATVNTCAPASETIIYNWDFPGGTPSSSNQLDPGTITYATTGSFQVTFSMTNSCGTTSVNENFNINETPTITNTDLTQTICSGTQTNEISITSDFSSTTFTWVANSPAGVTGFIPSGSTNTIPAQNIFNANTTASSLIYTVIPDLGGCQGAPVNFEIIIDPSPEITSHPIPSSVCQNGTANQLTVSFQGTGTPTYQWYENTVDNTTTGTAIAGETSVNFTPHTNTIGTTYYYVIITFATGGCNEIISNTAAVDVFEAPQIDTHPINPQTICVGGNSEELSITISGGAGNISYQWFSNTTNSNTGGTLIAGATNSSYTPPTFNAIGNYYFYVEVTITGSGCNNLISDVAEIIVINDPTIDMQPLISQELCQNVTPQNLIVTNSGGSGNTTFQWYSNTINSNTGGTPIAGATNNTFTPPTNSVGTLYYYCIVTQDISGCEVTSTTSAVIVTPAPLFAMQPISDTLCLGETTAVLSVSYTNGTGTPSYQWYSNTIDDTTSGTAITGETTPNYNPPVATVGTTFYYCIITFNSGGCSQIISNTAEIAISETPNISSTTILICSDNTFEYIPDNSSGDIVPVGTLYTWTTPTINPAGSIIGASAQTTPTTNISQLLLNVTTSPATVTYTVTPISGVCSGMPFNVVVTINPSISVIANTTNNSCFQSNDSFIDITISGGVPFTTGPPYQISWTGPLGFTSTNEDISNLDAGNYTLTINDNGGCPFTETYTITEPDELVFDQVIFDPETISCFGANDGNISITISGGTEPYAYSWTRDNVPFSNDEDLINLGPGNYQVTVTDANNCGPITQNFLIIEPPVLDVSLDNQTNIICFGESTGEINVITNGGRPNYTYSWTGPNGFVSTDQNLTNLFSGIYNLSVEDTSGCIDTLQVILIQNDQINIDVTTTDIVCYGDNDASITINNIFGGVGPYTIAWSNFGTGMIQQNLSAGTYTITITDTENCVRTFPITIDEPPEFSIAPDVTQISCFGENDARIVLNLVGGIDPVTVDWDDDATAGVERNNLGPGTYSVTITDGTPCVIQETFIIFDVPELQVSANVVDALDCDDTNSGSINTLIQGGTPPYTVLWSNGETTEDLSAITPGTYQITITDANDCQVQASWDVIRFEPIVLDVVTETEFNCDTRLVNQTFMATSSGGVPPFQYTWSSGTVSGANNEIMNTQQNGLVILDVVDSLGCTETFNFNVEIPVLGEAGFSTDSFGFSTFGIYSIQDPIQFTNEATGDYISMSWDFGDGNFSSEENPIHTYQIEGNYIVTQTVTYPFGCVYTSVITLIVEKGYKLIMPNAFTPNEDNLNDYFTPAYIGLENMQLDIYDTWGSLIYSEAGETIRGWDGKINDYEAENGNYYFKFSGDTFYGKTIKKRGAFVYIN